jgi:hypothetical protein
MKMKTRIILYSLIFLFCGFVYAEQVSDNCDGDNDYIPDLLELKLAQQFRPILNIGQNDLNLFYPVLGYNIPFSGFKVNFKFFKLL